MKKKEYMNELSDIKLWFEKAFPNPTDKNIEVQLGVHVEEFAEMLESLGLKVAAESMHILGTQLKTGRLKVSDLTIDRAELLDSIGDQIVTGIGVAHTLGMKPVEAVVEISASNWSKFVGGSPIFDENGKIKKGPDYFKPDLTKFY